MYSLKDVILDILKDELPDYKGCYLNSYPNSVEILYWNTEPTIYTINFSWDKIYSIERKKKLNKIKKSICSR